MVFTILPLFLTEELHVSHADLGMMEGIAISCAFLAKVYAGIASDRCQTRKPFIFIGSLICVLTKVLFACAVSPLWIFVTRFLDRLSKGIRSAPTDALIADISTPETYGRSYGLRQALYTAGGATGAFLTVLILHQNPHAYRTTFWLATIPAAIAVAISLRLPYCQQTDLDFKRPLLPRELWKWSNLRRFSLSFWVLLTVCFFLMLARFSEAFVILRAKQIGWAVEWLPLTIILMDVAHAAVAYFGGRFSSAYHQKLLVIASFFLFIAADALLFWGGGVYMLALGILLNGVHLGLSQGTLRALVAQETPPDLNGTAFALFHGSSGIAVLIGNIVAGKVSHHYGLAWSFFSGGIFVCVAMVILLQGHRTTTRKHKAIEISQEIPDGLRPGNDG